MRNYVLTKRLKDMVSKSNGKLSFEELDLIENRMHAILYLAEIYKIKSDVELTALDYKNITDILHVICMQDFGRSLQPKRVGVAKEFVSKLKNGQAVLDELIDELLFVNHYN